MTGSTFASQEHSERDDHRASLRAAVPAGLAVVATACTFLPWGASGAKTRNSYEIIDVADRAGVVPGSLSTVAAVWYLVPALCGLLLVSAAASRVRSAAAVATTLGVIVTVGGVLVLRSPLATEPGAIVGIVAGGATVMAGVAVLGAAWTTGRNR